MLTLQPPLLKLEAGSRLLDLGCGEGRHALGLAYLEAIAERPLDYQIYAVDLNRSDLITARQRLDDIHNSFATAAKTAACDVNFSQADGTRLPFDDASFSHVVCSEVLEHIPNYPQMLAEIQRVLKPGGRLCVSVPRAWPERICWALSAAYHQVEGGHIRIFKGAALRREISASGYRFTHGHGSHALHVPYWWLRCLFWQKGEDYWPVRIYHRFLVWDLFEKPWLTRCLDFCLNPIMGKSVVYYFDKKTSE
ncbi:class I SAM-dependent methyltransferase [Teredinibacter waterburyi]|uniref:class I SAM-dependent methyltransferase n=1 Tax=Teredinibacter waterburyi TaxID=1500538 RepID=UPI00165FD334|nr:class I SAM-dependent methyltransferase [Teredinibacter waterburyi]